MTVDGTTPLARHQNAVPLVELFDSAIKGLEFGSGSPMSGDGFLFSGNQHESVPRRLLLDRRLTPLERNAWQVFRLMRNYDGVTAFPTYEQLRPWLASMPCAGVASHETVARALTLLRLTRWLSLVRRRRDPRTGRIVGNLYVLHDEPLTPFETMQLDTGYLELVSQALGHSAKAVQVVGMNCLKEITDDPLLSGRSLPSRLQVLAERLASKNVGPPKSYPQQGESNESEESRACLLRNGERPTSESEVGLKPASDGALRNPKQGRTVRSKRINNEIRTTARERDQASAIQGIRLPDRFRDLKEEQQHGAVMALQQVDTLQRQAVLDEWVKRCRSSNIRNPAGYLFGIIQRAIRGEFNAWAKRTEPAPFAATERGTPPEPVQNMVPPEVARQHIDRLRDLLRKS